MDDGWRPLSTRESTEKDAFAGPFEGTPEWLFGPLWTWVCARYRLTWHSRDGEHLRRDAVDEYRRIAMVLRVSLESPGAPNPSDARGLRASLHEYVRQLPWALLDVADYALATKDFSGGYGADDAEAPAELDVLLRTAGSVYRVQADGDHFYLARRVPTEEQAGADLEMSSGGRPAEHLRRSWRAVFGRNPNPGEGYREAIRAVEAAAKPVVSPNNERTTLGTVIRDMRAAPAKWRVGLQHHTPGQQVPAVIEMLDLLWAGQTGRHGDADETKPLDVTQEQAEAAAQLAVLLVGWFRTGVVSLAS